MSSLHLFEPMLLIVPRFVLKVLLGEFADFLLSSQRVSSGKLEDLGFEFQNGSLDEALEDLIE